MRKLLFILALLWPTFALAVPVEQFTNNATATLNGSISSGASSLIINSPLTGAFPAAGRFRIIIDSEIIIVDSVSGGGLTFGTLTRGAEGTAAASHLNAATVGEYVTAGSLGAVDRLEYNLCSGSGPNGGTYQCYEQVTNHVPEVSCFLSAYANTGAAQTCSFTAASAPGFASTSFITSNTRPVIASLTGLNTINLPTMVSTDGLTVTGPIIVDGQ